MLGSVGQKSPSGASVYKKTSSDGRVSFIMEVNRRNAYSPAPVRISRLAATASIAKRILVGKDASFIRLEILKRDARAFRHALLRIVRHIGRYTGGLRNKLIEIS